MKDSQVILNFELLNLEVNSKKQRLEIGTKPKVPLNSTDFFLMQVIL